MNKSEVVSALPGVAPPQERILEAARSRFLIAGYHDTSLRGIARDAGVDVALVAYYFGSKHGLFSAAFSLSANPFELLEEELKGDMNTLAERVLRRLLTTWDEAGTGPPLVALIEGAVTEPRLNKLLSDTLSQGSVAAIASHLEGTDAEERAAAFSVQTVGLVFTRYVLHLEPIASWSVETAVAALAPGLQRALTDS